MAAPRHRKARTVKSSPRGQRTWKDIATEALEIGFDSFVGKVDRSSKRKRPPKKRGNLSLVFDRLIRSDPRVKKYLSRQPKDVQDAFLQAASSGAISGGSHLTAEGCIKLIDLVKTKLEEGRRLSQLKKEVWGDPIRAEAIANQLASRGVDQRIIQKIRNWGQKKP